MAVQTVYPNNIPAAKPGHVSNMEKSNLISRTILDDAGVGFGLPVVDDTVSGTARLVTTGDTHILGIVAREQTGNPLTPNKIGKHESAAILTLGVIHVLTKVAVKAGDPVLVIVATGEFTNATGAGNVAIDNARFDRDAGAGELVRIRLG